MTRQEIENDIRSIERRCKGPYTLSADDRSALHQMWRRVDDAHNWDAAMTFKQSLEKATNTGSVPVEENDWESLFRHVAELMFGHAQNCGYDVNDLILSYPLDGEEKRANCLKCGSPISWIPAIYE